LKRAETPTPAEREQRRRDFLALKSVRELADMLGIKYERLIYHVYKVPSDQKYKLFGIKKKASGTRVISAPVTPLKIIQQELNKILLDVYEPKPSVHGYVRGKNIVINAKKHKRARLILNIDLEDFFPSINFGRVRGMFLGNPYFLPPKVATVLAQICCFNNQLPQGAPTSPVISNMICARMDSQLQHLAFKYQCYYTRYADDITISTFHKELPAGIATALSITETQIGNELNKIIETNGFRINLNKVRLQPRFRRQEVTGIVVNQFPNVRRKYIRQVRAMLHAWEAHGLTNAEKDYFTKYAGQKHRNPELELPSFRQILKGMISYIGMVKGRGRDSRVFLKLMSKYDVLRARDEGVPRLRREFLDDLNKPRVFVEGKTDVAILKTSWKKLYGDLPMQFEVVVADTRPNTSGGGAGADSISLLLNAHRADDPYIAIGLFDRDKTGKAKFRSALQSDFLEDSVNAWKVAADRRAGALLLPVPAGREDYDYYDTICIEFFFSDDVLLKKAEDGSGLTLEYKKLDVEGKRLPENLQVPIPAARTVKGSKVAFAERIIPLLDAGEFTAFRPLFELIVNLINVFQ
jgi:RNA-directed DNA polymerase